MDVSSAIIELRAARPERQYILAPYLGLKETEVLVRYFHLDDKGKRSEDPYYSHVVDFSTDEGLTWIWADIQAAKARTGKLFTA